MTDYKNYAADLYDIKLTVARRPKENCIVTLEAFLKYIHDLRPQFRLELNDLLKEFISANPEITHEEMEELRIINDRFIRKLQALVNQIRTKIRKLRSISTSYKTLPLT